MTCVQVFDGGLPELPRIILPASAQFCVQRSDGVNSGSGDPTGYGTILVNTELIKFELPKYFFDLYVPGRKGTVPFFYTGVRIYKVATPSRWMTRSMIQRKAKRDAALAKQTGQPVFTAQQGKPSFTKSIIDVTFDSIRFWTDCPEPGRMIPAWANDEPIRWQRGVLAEVG